MIDKVGVSFGAAKNTARPAMAGDVKIPDEIKDGWKKPPVTAGLIDPPDKDDSVIKQPPVLAGLVSPPDKNPVIKNPPVLAGLISPPDKNPQRPVIDPKELKELLDRLNQELTKDKYDKSA